MTKSEFVDQVCARLESSGVSLTKKDVAATVDAVTSTIEETLKGGGEVVFTGFGKFSVRDQAAREGVHPQTGKRMQIPASKVPRFAAGSALKKAVKGL